MAIVARVARSCWIQDALAWLVKPWCVTLTRFVVKNVGMAFAATRQWEIASVMVVSSPTSPRRLPFPLMSVTEVVAIATKPKRLQDVLVRHANKLCATPTTFVATLSGTAFVRRRR